MTVTPEPKERYWTRQSIEKLALKFSLPHNDNMQDWPYEISDPNRVEEFFDALKDYATDQDTQFTLMDLVLQSLEESKIELFDSKIGFALQSYLKEHFETHAYQIWYWSAFDNKLTDSWRISPFIRNIWNEMNSEE